MGSHMEAILIYLNVRCIAHTEHKIPVLTPTKPVYSLSHCLNKQMSRTYELVVYYICSVLGGI